MNNDGRITTNIIEKHFYQSTTLPKAPERLTLAEAEADEARGVELAAFLAILPTLTAEQWSTSQNAGRDAARDASRVAAYDAAWVASRGDTREAYDAAWDASRGALWGAGWAAQAIVVRDRISAEHFNILTAPMRAAGIDFDNLGGTP